MVIFTERYNQLGEFVKGWEVSPFVRHGTKLSSLLINILDFREDNSTNKYLTNTNKYH